jgi:ElaB/YqjD/DUF883 family membrane-anchored ribosome-binding protein
METKDSDSRGAESRRLDQPHSAKHLSQESAEGAELQELFNRGLRLADDAVHQHPYYSLWVALAAGVTLGTILRRR